MKFNELIKKDVILLDGGFGTELIKKGLKPGEDSASAVFEHPQWVEEIHRSYVEAGSDVILADTFGANAFKMKYSPYTVEESIKEAVIDIITNDDPLMLHGYMSNAGYEDVVVKEAEYDKEGNFFRCFKNQC